MGVNVLGRNDIILVPRYTTGLNIITCTVYPELRIMTSRLCVCELQHSNNYYFMLLRYAHTHEKQFGYIEHLGMTRRTPEIQFRGFNNTV